MKIKTMADAVEKLRKYVLTECYKYDYCTNECPFYTVCHWNGVDWSTLTDLAEAYDLDHEGRA